MVPNDAPTQPAQAPPQAQPQPPQKAPLKFLFVSLEGLIGDLCWQLKKEGCEVRYYIHQKTEKDVSDGFVDKVDEWEPHADWADAIVFDDVEFGDTAAKLRKQGKAVVGGAPYADRLEMEREFGQAEMKGAGINILPYWTFNNFDEAIEFVTQNPARYVIKPSGAAQGEKVLSFVGQDEDGKDILDILRLYKPGWGKKIKSFQLQKYAAGVEVAVGAFFNGKEFITPVNVNFEHKRMFPGEIGPSTGEMGCYDEETEVLTASGWKHFRDLIYDDMICTLNPNGHIIEYHHPTQIVAYTHHRELVCIRNRAIDIAVTPDHNMYICPQQEARTGRRRFRFVKARELEAQSVIPRTGVWVGSEVRTFVLPGVDVGHYSGRQVLYQRTADIEISMDDWLSFAGIWLADGYTSEGYRVAVAQKTPGKTERVAELLERMPFRFREHGAEFYTYDKQLHAYLSVLGRAEEKYVPDFVKSLPPRQIGIFLDWFALGDATVMRQGWRIFYTSSKRLADDIQELLLKTGRLGTVKRREARGAVEIGGHTAHGTRPQYEVHERIRKSESWLDRRDMMRVRYNGTVYCATVPNHIMYVRRNGHAYWGGNTSMFWCPPNRIFNETLGKMTDKLRESGYVGYIDINTICNSRGIYPLEFTSRFGYPTISIQMEGVQSPWGEFLHGLAKGEKPVLKTKRGFQVGVVLAVPPFPFTDPVAYRKYSEEAVIIFRRPMNDGVHLGDVKQSEGTWRLAGQSGYALIMTGSGTTMDDARRQAYQRVENILIPNLFYRTDIGARWSNDSDRLQTWGYLYGT